LVRPGFAADLAIFDPATINTLEPEYVQDLPANETRMIQRAAGVHHTVVNGEVVIENGAATGACPGRVLRPRRWKTRSDSEDVQGSMFQVQRFNAFRTLNLEL
jgi:N-acyl-D-aspartate/D-glutamate deacylase